jgi:hypothetical protein
MAGILKRTAYATGAVALAGAATLAAEPSAVSASAATLAPLKGYSTVVGDPVALPANAQRSGTVRCPIGTVSIGGGVFPQSSSPLISLNSSFPLTGGWEADVNNASATATTFRVRVICAVKPAQYVVVQKLGLANPAHARTTIAVTCPVGTTALSGGAASNSESVLVNSGGMAPANSRSWQISENNGDVVGHLVSVVAVCANVSGYAIVHGPVLSVAGHSSTSPGARCPVGLRPVGGGAVIQSSSLGTYLNDTAFAASNNWVSAATNTSATAVKASSTVVCAKAQG